jgi:hypothetical protein
LKEWQPGGIQIAALGLGRVRTRFGLPRAPKLP